MDKLLLMPPVTFIIVLLSVLALAYVLSLVSFKRKDQGTEIGKSYACGEETVTNLAQPDYSQFFPFAFFFTILHVVTLIITTAPIKTMQSFAIAVIYVLGAIAGLFILFRG